MLPGVSPGRAPHRTGAALAVAREPGGRAPRARARLPDADPGRSRSSAATWPPSPCTPRPGRAGGAGRTCGGSSRRRRRRSSYHSRRCSCRRQRRRRLRLARRAARARSTISHPREVPQWFVFSSRAGALRGRGAGRGDGRPVRPGLRRGAPERVRLFAALALPTLTRHAGRRLRWSARRSTSTTPRTSTSATSSMSCRSSSSGFALWMEEGLPRPSPWAWVVVLVSAGSSSPSDRATGVQQRAPVDGAPAVGCLADLVVGARRCPRRSRSAADTSGFDAAARGGTSLDRRPRRHGHRRRCGPVDPRRRRLERREAVRGLPSGLGRRVASRRRGRSSCSGISASPHAMPRTPSTPG